MPRWASPPRSTPEPPSTPASRLLRGSSRAFRRDLRASRTRPCRRVRCARSELEESFHHVWSRVVGFHMHTATAKTKRIIKNARPCKGASKVLCAWKTSNNGRWKRDGNGCGRPNMRETKIAVLESMQAGTQRQLDDFQRHIVVMLCKEKAIQCCMVTFSKLGSADCRENHVDDLSTISCHLYLAGH